MKLLKGLLLCCLVFAIHGEDEEVITSTDTTGETTDIPTTTPVATTPSTKPTTPSTKPTTEKPTQEPTTEVPTTQGPTTKVPTTTPSPPPPTTVKPETTGDWSVNYAGPDNGTCIHLRMQASLNILYPKDDNTNGTATIDLMSNAKPTKDSTCQGDKGVQVLALKFEDVLTLKFVFNKSDDNVFVQDISCTYTYDKAHFPNASHEGTTKEDELTGQQLFSVGNGKSWKCDDPKPVEFESVTLNLKNFQYQAYTDEGTKGNSFLSEENCVDQGNDVVPIVVGCALAALVLIVLIAYLIGRRRSRQKAEYQSM